MLQALAKVIKIEADNAINRAIQARRAMYKPLESVNHGAKHCSISLCIKRAYRSLGARVNLPVSEQYKTQCGQSKSIG